MEKNKCKECNRVEWYHSKGNMHNHCKEFIPLNHSSSDKGCNLGDKDSSDETISENVDVSRIDEGSAFILSDKVGQYGGYEGEDVAEFIRLLKEEVKFQIFNQKFISIEYRKMINDRVQKLGIDKLSGDFK